jgi:acetate kinase
MAVDTLVLAANPGSASRKYALYKNNDCIASLHFEHEDQKIVCTLVVGEKSQKLQPGIEKLEDAPQQVLPILKNAGIDIPQEALYCIGLRLVAPKSYFLQDRLLNDEALQTLINLERLAPLHIKASLEEATHLRASFAQTPIVAISDSAFHATKPDYAWNYAIPLEDADRLEVKRFGFHGSSLASVVRELTKQNKLPDKLIVCHLGSGNSVTAIFKGQSVETTMGYSPLEGLMMATRSGSLDVMAAKTLQRALALTDSELEVYLNKKSGLLGVSGLSSDIRDLVKAEAAGNKRAALALKMYVYRIQQAIGQMAAVLDGIEAVVFTGAVGCRSAVIRERVINGLSSFGLSVDNAKNQSVVEPDSLQVINKLNRTKLVYVMTTNEAYELALKAFRWVHQNIEKA